MPPPFAGEQTRRVALDVILPGASKTFMDLFAAHVQSEAERRRDAIACSIHRFEGIDPHDLARRIVAVADAGSEGVAMVAIDHPAVREAIRSVTARGVPVLTLMSDISGVSSAGYIGIDNRAAGRLAAPLLGRFLPRSTLDIALFTGNLSYRGHEEREMGFRHVIAHDFSHLNIVHFTEMGEDSRRSFAEMRTLLAARPELAGLYNIGGALRGIAEAVREAGRSETMVIVGHELTDPIRPFLVDGTIDAVIDQNPRVEAREALERLRRAALGEDVRDWVSIRTQVIFKENLPSA
jgi:LacI family transcriptional regulator